MSANDVTFHATVVQRARMRVQEATAFLPWEQWSARGWWSLVAGIPAVFAVLFVLVLSITLLMSPLRLRHVREAVEARVKASERARDYESVRVDCERLLRDDPTDESATLSLALAFRGLNEPDAASQLLNRLAPLDSVKGAGYSPAHLLLAQELLSDTTNLDSRLLAERHLLRVTEVHPRQPLANALLAGLYANDWKRCREHLKYCYGVLDEQGLALSEFCLSNGDRQMAVEWAERAKSIFKHRCALNPADDVARANWAQAELLLGNYGVAANILQEGLTRGRSDLLRATMLKTYQKWGESLGGDEQNRALREDLQRKMRELQQ
jgi:hypothetical protein